MAIDLAHFRIIVESGAKGSALSAGYPDLLVPLEVLKRHVDPKFIEHRPQGYELAKHHGWPEPLYDTRRVFEGLGLTLDVIDRRHHEGSERVVDLNVAFPLGWCDGNMWDGCYDLVIDPGTIEHCFNIGQAAVNLASAVKVGGFICQAIPMSMCNHGYYNLCPKWFIDFYGQNGFEIYRLGMKHDQGFTEGLTRHNRYMGVPDNAVLICLAKRLTVQPFVWPVDEDGEK